MVEVRKYQSLIQQKSGMDDEKFERLLKSFRRRIAFVETEEFIDLLEEAEKISPDEGDAPYVALSLKLNVGIWSNDKALKDKQTALWFIIQVTWREFYAVWRLRNPLKTDIIITYKLFALPFK